MSNEQKKPVEITGSYGIMITSQDMWDHVDYKAEIDTVWLEQELKMTAATALEKATLNVVTQNIDLQRRIESLEARLDRLEGKK